MEGLPADHGPATRASGLPAAAQEPSNQSSTPRPYPVPAAPRPPGPPAPRPAQPPGPPAPRPPGQLSPPASSAPRPPGQLSPPAPRPAQPPGPPASSAPRPAQPPGPPASSAPRPPGQLSPGPHARPAEATHLRKRGLSLQPRLRHRRGPTRQSLKRTPSGERGPPGAQTSGCRGAASPSLRRGPRHPREGRTPPPPLAGTPAHRSAPAAGPVTARQASAAPAPRAPRPRPRSAPPRPGRAQLVHARPAGRPGACAARSYRARAPTAGLTLRGGPGTSANRLSGAGPGAGPGRSWWGGAPGPRGGA
ncbi:proline-rich protein 2-like [Ochotona princeps]|uniref:proline-rich protein 2-like n=1 Tax=Ochotona princeps TaxID=9978 RepID=UPI002714AA04|nr:proline-rich protein 2-like [Ochotona princeps]